MDVPNQIELLMMAYPGQPCAKVGGRRILKRSLHMETFTNCAVTWGSVLRSRFEVATQLHLPHPDLVYTHMPRARISHGNKCLVRRQQLAVRGSRRPVLGLHT